MSELMAVPNPENHFQEAERVLSTVEGVKIMVIYNELVEAPEPQPSIPDPVLPPQPAAVPTTITDYFDQHKLDLAA